MTRVEIVPNEPGPHYSIPQTESNSAEHRGESIEAAEPTHHPGVEIDPNNVDEASTGEESWWIDGEDSEENPIDGLDGDGDPMTFGH